MGFIRGPCPSVPCWHQIRLVRRSLRLRALERVALAANVYAPVVISQNWTSIVLRM